MTKKHKRKPIQKPANPSLILTYEALCIDDETGQIFDRYTRQPALDMGWTDEKLPQLNEKLKRRDYEENGPDEWRYFHKRPFRDCGWYECYRFSYQPPEWAGKPAIIDHIRGIVCAQTEGAKTT
jgi:hypothetical protein